MDDIVAIADLITSLRSAVEITKAIMDISDANRLRAEILHLTKEIMSAQSCALATQSALVELLQSKQGLEDELAKLKAWNMEKYRYELQNVGSGAIAYVLKQSMRGTEPIHWICANCFQVGKKRFLNESHFDLHFVYYKCQECAGKIRIRKAPQAPEPDLESFEFERRSDLSCVRCIVIRPETHQNAGARPAVANQTRRMRAISTTSNPQRRGDFVLRDVAEPCEHGKLSRTVFLPRCKSEALFLAIEKIVELASVCCHSTGIRSEQDRGASPAW